MKVRRGDVFMVDLGEKDDDDTRGHETYKQRRSVVVQNDVGNQNSPLTIVAPITGGHTSYPFQVNLPGWKDYLEKDSHVECNQIRTVDIAERLGEKKGSVSSDMMDEIDEALKISLGLR